jgi:hypothetical protein
MPIKKLFLISVTATIILQLACIEGGIEPIISKIEYHGFEDKFALRMVLAEPYLYVCAGSDGVWRRNIRKLMDWEYLGLKDTSLGKYTNVGALDIDVLGDDILVAYNGSAQHVEAESTISVWRSIDGGENWFRSDSGIPETIDFSVEHNLLTSLERSPHKDNIVISLINPAIYRSTNGATHWTLLSGERGVITGLGDVRWHPFRPGEVWFFGENALFAPYCFARKDYGLNSKTALNWDSLGFAYDGAVYDIAFDAGNPDIVYVTTSQGVVKTKDGGYTWQKNVINLPDNGYVFRTANHPSIPGVLYLAGGKGVYMTRDGGKTVHLVEEIEHGFITSLAFDPQYNKLFVGTTEGGIYGLKFGR